MARLVAYGHAGIDPKIMGLGPVQRRQERAEEGRPEARRHRRHRIERSVRRAGARRVAASSTSTRAKVNPNGGAVALGHPIGATGAILTVKAMYELQRTGKRYALITMCIGGGQGIAAIIERM